MSLQPKKMLYGRLNEKLVSLEVVCLAETRLSEEPKHLASSARGQEGC